MEKASQEIATIVDDQVTPRSGAVRQAEEHTRVARTKEEKARTKVARERTILASHGMMLHNHTDRICRIGAATGRTTT